MCQCGRSVGPRLPAEIVGRLRVGYLPEVAVVSADCAELDRFLDDEDVVSVALEVRQRLLWTDRNCEDDLCGAGIGDLPETGPRSRARGDAIVDNDNRFARYLWWLPLAAVGREFLGGRLGGPLAFAFEILLVDIVALDCLLVDPGAAVAGRGTDGELGVARHRHLLGRDDIQRRADPVGDGTCHREAAARDTQHEVGIGVALRNQVRELVARICPVLEHGRYISRETEKSRGRFTVRASLSGPQTQAAARTIDRIMVSGRPERDNGEPVELSPTRLNLLCDCPRCFWVRMCRGTSRPEKAFPSIVAGVERELRTVLDQHRDAGTLPHVLRESRLDAALVTDREFLSNCRTWQNEPTVHDDASGAVLRGAMDDLLKRPDGSYVPLDYKTHNAAPDEVHPAYRRQLECYAYLLRENDYPTADFGLLLYLYPTSSAAGVRMNADLHWVPLRLDRPQTLMQRATTVLSGPVPDYTEDCEFCSWAETA